mmetsp:Transcript_9301/g.56634  ORF Transcript_9301/g.56634 Transcript_9301/m.56634 type:complete len:174 (+) Transcript_9301:3382-3903(+)
MAIAGIAWIALLGLGYVYPAYQCYKTVERRESGGNEELKRWCTYWIILAIFTVSEGLLDRFVGWMPLYGFAKVGLVVYLWHPKTMGSTHAYHQFLRPFLKKHEGKIDRQLKEVQTYASSKFEKYYTVFMNWFNKRFSEAVNHMAKQAQQQQPSNPATGKHFPPGAQRNGQKVR